jgi:hypothetical protein
MNKTIVFGVIWRYVKFLISFILLLMSVNALNLISIASSFNVSLSILTPPSHPNEKEFEDWSEKEMGVFQMS